MTTPTPMPLSVGRGNRVALPSVRRLTTHFAYLDGLRESGVTNMFGAPPYLEDAFKMKRDVAVAVTGAWMKTFSDEDAAVRAAKATGAA